MNPVSFADALRGAMDGLTQEQLEEQSGVSQAMISKYLRGVAKPRLDQLEALERALPRLRDLRHAAA